jgi:triacylglycerol lipase
MLSRAIKFEPEYVSLFCTDFITIVLREDAIFAYEANGMSENGGGKHLSFLDLLQEFRVVREVATFAQQAWTWPIARTSERSKVILLIPGFLAGDATLYPFANWLRSRGHQVHFSGMLANADCPRRAVDRLSGILKDLAARTGGKLVIIGHSLGGIYARELSRRHPELVDQVILLGAPVRDPRKNSNPFVKMLATLTLRMHESGCHCPGGLSTVCGINGDVPPPGVRETIIYSKSDGVVDWASCIETGPDVQAFEVHSTHMGIPYNLDTLRIIRERIEKTATAREAQARMQST